MAGGSRTLPSHPTGRDGGPTGTTTPSDEIRDGARHPSTDERGTDSSSVVEDRTNQETARIPGDSQDTSPRDEIPGPRDDSSRPARPSRQKSGPDLKPTGGAGAPVIDFVHTLSERGVGKLYVEGSVDVAAAVGASFDVEFYLMSADDFEKLKTISLVKESDGPVSFRAVIPGKLEAGEAIVARAQRNNDPADRVSLPRAAIRSTDVDWDEVDSAIESRGLNRGDGNRDGILDAAQPHVVSLPAASGKFIALDAHGHVIRNVRLDEIDKRSPSRAEKDFGVINFEVANLPRGGRVAIDLWLPEDALVNTAFKRDPETGQLFPFNFDGTTGVEFHDNYATIHLVDGGRGDADGVANGIIVDPLVLDNSDKLIDTIVTSVWSNSQEGGSTDGKGTVFVNDEGQLELQEGDSFVVWSELDYTFPLTSGKLVINYIANFDSSDSGRINDAFEVVLRDDRGESLVPTIGHLRDSFFNVTEGQEHPLLGTTTQHEVTTTEPESSFEGAIYLDVSHLADGETERTIVLRLVNNDGDTGSRVRILGNAPPVAQNDTYTIDEDSQLLVGTAGVVGVLENDSDPDGDDDGLWAHRYFPESGNGQEADGPFHGTVSSFSEDGAFVYTPNADVSGVYDTFLYRAFDGLNYSDPTTVTIHIAAVNDPPVARDDHFSTDESTAVVGDLLRDNGEGPDSDADGDLIHVTELNGTPLVAGMEITLNSGALVSVQEDGEFSYDPNGQFDSLVNGETEFDSFMYTITDGVETSTATVTITITGVGAATVSITATDSEAAEEGSDPGQFTVALDDGKTAAADITVSYSVTGTATGGTDYAALSGSVVIAGGSGSATIDVSGIVDDALVEGDETVIVTLTAASDPGVDVNDAADEATVTIADNDDTTVSIEATDSDAAEEGSDPGQFTVALDDGKTAAADITVSYSVTGTATGGTDYTALSGSVVIAAGSGSATIDVSGIADDVLVEGDETVIVTLTAASDPGVDVNDAADEATVTIADNDDTTVSITATDSAAAEEGSDPGQFTVALDDGKTAAADITVSYSVTGTATGGTDYAALSGSVVIAAGSGSATIDVSGIVDDVLVEGDETVIVTLTAASDPGVDVNDTADEATVTIADNDQNLAPIAIDDSFTLNEGAPFSANVITQIDIDGNADYDPDGDNFTAALITEFGDGPVFGPVYGTVELLPDGSFTYIPDRWIGAAKDQFSYRLTDQWGATSNVAVVTLDINETTDPARQPPFIIDNGDDRFTLTPITATSNISFFAHWNEDVIGAGFQGDALYNHADGGIHTATWAFGNLTPGRYRVSVTYPTQLPSDTIEDLATDAPYSVYDDDFLLKTVDVNQRLLPNDFFDRDVYWEDLGVFEIESTTLAVRLTDDADGIVRADAIRLEPISSGPELTVTDLENVVVDGARPVELVTPITTPLMKTFVISNDGAADLEIYSITLASAYKGNITLDAPFGSITLPPGDSTSFSVTLDATTLAEQGDFPADVRIASNDESEAMLRIPIRGIVTNHWIKDDEHAGFSNNWSIATGSGFQDTSRSTPADGSGDWAAWTFSGLPAGNYRVSTSFDADPMGTTAAPFTVLNNGQSIPTVVINQQDVLDDENAFEADGAYWKNIHSSLAIAAGTLTVRLTDLEVQSNRSVIADAVRIERLYDDASAHPDITVQEGGNDVIDDFGLVDFGHTVPGRVVSKTFTWTQGATQPVQVYQPLRVPRGFSVPPDDFASSHTFELKLDANHAGTFEGEVVFGTDDPDEGPFNFFVKGVVDASRIIDDLHPTAFAKTPGFSFFTQNEQGFDRHVHVASGDGSGDTATWTFDGLQPGMSYTVSATWSPAANRATNAPFTIEGASGGPATIYVNQQQTPDDRYVNGTAFEDLGTFTANASTLSVTLADNANGDLIADAIRIQPVLKPEAQIWDGATYLVDGMSTVDFGVAGVGEGTLDRTFTIENIGTSELALGAPTLPVGFEIVGATPTTVPPHSSVTLTIGLKRDPGPAPNPDPDPNAIRSSAGAYFGKLTIPLDDVHENPFELFLKGTIVDSSNRTIIDNSATGGEFAQSGFLTYTDAGREGNKVTSAGGSGADTATYTFANLTPGLYRVSATWPSSTLGATNTPVSIYDGAPAGGAALTTRLLNQKLAPNGFLDDGSVWDDVGIVRITGDTLTVQLTDAANGYVIADAIRIEALTYQAEIQIEDSAGQAIDSSGSFDFGTVVSGATVPRTEVFTITNFGTKTLDLGRLRLSDNFILDGPLATSLSPDASTTFTVRFAPDRVDHFTGHLRLASNDSNENPFEITLLGNVEPQLVVIDDGSGGYSDTGFTVYGGEGYQSDVRQSTAGAGKTATWTFHNLNPDTTYRVSATWTSHANRASDAPYTIRDTVGGDITYRVNQKVSPNDFNDGGAAWEDLGIVRTVSGAPGDPVTLIVELGDNANGAVIADAIRIEELPAHGPEIQVVASQNVPDGGSVDLGTTPKAEPLETTFTVINMGTSNLSLSGLSLLPVASELELIFDPSVTYLAPGESLQFTVRLDTTDLGNHTASIYIDTNDADEDPYSLAIAADVVAPVTIIDDGGAGYTDSGNWGLWHNQGYQNDVREAPSGGPTETATYSFSGLTEGDAYRVSITWTSYSNRATDVPYTVSGVEHGPFSFAINQRQNPNDLTAESAVWEDLGVFTVDATGAILVTLSGSTTGNVIADAVRIERLVDDEFQETKFFVPDAAQAATYRYASDGGYHGAWSTAAQPRGATSNAAGDRLWLLTDNAVHIYDQDDNAIGDWNDPQWNDPQGIATDGNHIWVVDRAANAIYYYEHAAVHLNPGVLTADSSFALDAANNNAYGLTTDGSTLWVIDDADPQAKVFVYDTQGQLLGSWSVDANNLQPRGLTIDPTGGDDLWIVDQSSDSVYYYENGATFQSGTHSATSLFPLDSSNILPEGIADPPAITVLDPAPGSQAPMNKRGTTSTQLPEAPLQVAGGAANPPSNDPLLTIADVDSLKSNAASYWQTLNLTAEQTTKLSSVTFVVEALDGGLLGQAAGTTITLDTDAAGYGWFVDDTPEDNHEFQPEASGQFAANAGEGAESRLDLLTVMMHEIGHVLGFDDLDPVAHPTTLMAAELPVGIRRLPGRNKGGPEVFHWNVDEDGQWNEPTNWSPQGIPGPRDMAVIDRPDADVTVTLSAVGEPVEYAISSVHVAETLELLHLASLDVAAASLVSGSLFVNGGELSGDGVLTVDGSLDWTSGSMSGGGTTAIGRMGSLNLHTIPDAWPPVTVARRIENEGTVVWTGDGDLAFGTNGAFINRLDGVFQVYSNPAMIDSTESSGDVSFTNEGVFRKLPSTEWTRISVPFDNLGTLDVQSGTLTFGRGLANAGYMMIPPGATVDVSYAGESSSSSGEYFTQVAGQTQLLGGTLLAAEIDLQAGTLTGFGTIVGNLTNAGQVQVAAGDLSVSGDYVQSGTGSLSLEIGGYDPDTDYDHLHVTGSVTLAGTVEFTESSAPLLRDEYVLIVNDDSDAIMGAFLDHPNLPQPTLAGENLQITYTGGSGNDFALRFPLAVRIDDVAKPEGDAGTTVFSFPVTLPRALDTPLLIGYSTQDGTAIAPVDYLPAEGTLYFAEGETEKFVPITVYGDTAAAAAESFRVDISWAEDSPVAAENQPRTSAVGTILNDDNELLEAERRFVFTSTEDFLEGSRSRTTAFEDELRLTPDSSGMFPFVNIAASERGTIVRIDVTSGEVVGEYNTAPGWRTYGQPDPEFYMGHDPSRTTVDLFGNVWVGNRDESSLVDGFPAGSVTRIGVILGGVRGNKVDNGDGTYSVDPDPEGEYLQGPFQYSTAVDRDGDGLIKTSRGLGHILDWTNAGGSDSLGGVSTADDELILNYTRTVGAGTRTVAVDGNNDVWVGGRTDYDHEKISGETGMPIPGTYFNFGAGGYGGLVDGNGVLWSARSGLGLLRFVPDPENPPGTGHVLGNNTGDYGLALDVTTGHIWHSSRYGGNLHLYELDSNGNVVSNGDDDNAYPQPFPAQGVAVDANRHVWMAEHIAGQSQGQRVWHLAPDPHNSGRHISVGEVGGMFGITGVAVDVNGKIWAPGTGGAYRIDPNAGPIGDGGYPIGAVDLVVPLGENAGPYNYSDMTGFVSWNAFAHGTWTHTVDSENLNNLWHSVLTDATIPDGAAVEIHVRAANDRAVVDLQPYQKIESEELLTDVSGRYLQVRLTLRTDDPAVLPSVQELIINADASRPRIRVESPAHESRLDVDLETVITGHAFPGRTGVPLAAVLIDGTPVDALDAGGAFFTRVTIAPGYNTFEFTAIDVAGATDTQTHTLIGDPGEPPQTQLQKMTDLAEFITTYYWTSFHDQDEVLYADIELTNSGPYAVDGPLYLGVTNLSDPRVHVYQPDGVSEEGIPYFDFSNLVGDGVFSPGEMTSAPYPLSFANPHRTPFTYDLVLLGGTNRPPGFTTVPKVAAVNGQQYSYASHALDPEGNPVSYSLTAHPDSMTIDAAGVVTWPVEQVQLGNHTVTVTATDDRGASTAQSFTLTVQPPAPNRPPVFDSVPVVTAYVDTEYSYDADASDPDGDVLFFSLTDQPVAELEIDPVTGLLNGWTPQADQVGDHPLTISVTDDDPDNEGLAEQNFIIRVLAAAGNRSPVITSQAITQVLAGAEYWYQVVAVDADRDDSIAYALEFDPIPTGMTIDTDTGLIVWPAPVDGQVIAVRVNDGRGGADRQQFTLSVISGPAGSVAGAVFDDANENGQQDVGETGLSDHIVYADRNQNRQRDADEPYAAADAAGDYLITDLLAGSYTLLLERPAGWVQTAPASPVTVEVTAGNPDAISPDFGLVQRDEPNRPPVFISTPLSAADVGEPLNYMTAADDPDGDALEYTLAYGPQGMAVESRSGRVVWTPDATQAGVVYAAFRVSDGRGGVALQPTAVIVTDTNGAPVFNTQPLRLARIQDGTYTYDADATDPDMPIEYWLDQASLLRGMTVDSESGVVAWPAAAITVGSYPVTVWAADNNGQTAYQYYRLHVTDVLENRPPQVAGAVELTIPAEVPWSHRIAAVDPDDDPLGFTLQYPDPNDEIAGLTTPTDGVITWTPAVGQVTNPDLPHEFSIVVDDGPGGHNVVQSYRLHVVADLPHNDPPVITSSPRRIALAGEVYAYQAVAEDPQGHTVRWHLEQQPLGMTVDPDTGLVLWAPSVADLGTQTIVVVAVDAYGAADRQTYNLTVSAQNRPPYFTSPPRTFATVDQVYSYAATARDPDHQDLRFTLQVTEPGGSLLCAAPGGGAPQCGSPGTPVVDPQTGVILWTPQASHEGLHRVDVRVLDTLGLDAVQTFRLDVAPTPPNHPPIIRNAPETVAVVGKPYEFLVDAVDPDHAFSELTFDVQTDPALDPQQHGDLQFVAGHPNLLRWDSAPASLAGQQIWVTVQVSDPAAPDPGVAEKRYALTVRQNNLPTVAVANQTITAGQDYAYDVTATDADSQDTLTYSLAFAPAGMTIDAALGRIRWQDSRVGDHPITVLVSDGIDTVSGSYALQVLPDDQPPQVQLAVSQRVADAGQQVWIWVLATDDVGVSQRTLTVDGQTVTLDAQGAVLFTLQGNFGHVFNLQATARDAAGNVGGPVSGELVIRNPHNLAPQVTLDLPADGATVTAPTDIVGSITDSDAKLVSYTISITPHGRTAPIRVDTVTAPPDDPGGFLDNLENAVLGQFDPTLLPNGAYQVLVEAVDFEGRSDSAQFTVAVDGHLKLGNFTLSFTDVELPVAGFPISVTRTYDTLRAGEQGDFGYGWTMDLSQVTVDVVQPRSDGGPPEPFFDGDRIVFTLPDGSRHGFTFLPRRVNPGSFINDRQYWPAFVADLGQNSSLTLSGRHPALLQSGGGYEDTGMNRSYNPAAGLYGDYVLELRNGTRLMIDPQQGTLRRLTDRTGNTLTFTRDGIQHSAGRSVEFVRDTRGRITQIVLPDTTPGDDEDNPRVKYDYHLGSGDLISVTDLSSEITRFEYLPDRPHYLDKIIDPLGRPAARTEYDDDGRVKKVIDADGQTIEYQWDAASKIQHITDQLGNTSIVEADARGNVIREEDPTGGIVLRTYDDDDNVLTETTVIDEVDPGSDDQANDLTTTYVYDPTTGDLLQTVDPRGNGNLTTYNQYGQPLTTTDELGNTTNNSYDSRGLLTSIRDANKNVTRFGYDAKGNLQDVYNHDDVRLVHTTHNQYGDVTSTTPAAGRTTYFDYDVNGDQIATWYFDTSAGQPAPGTQILDVTHYDAARRVTGTRRLVLPSGQHLTSDIASVDFDDPTYDPFTLSTTGTDYNAVGQVISSTDQLENATETIYDKRGLAIETRHESSDEAGNTAWLISRTIYDAAGRAVITTDSFVQGDTLNADGFDVTTMANATFSEYDASGRVTGTMQLKDIVVVIEGPTNSAEVTGVKVGASEVHTDLSTLKDFLTNQEAVITTTSTKYVDGRVTETTDSFLRKTESVYDRYGQTIETRIQARRASEGVGIEDVWLVTRTVYDDYGRAFLTTDQYVDNNATPEPSSPAVYATRTIYDAQGRAHKSQRLEGVVVTVGQVSNLPVTQLTAPGTVISTSETIYNDRGQTARTIAADGQITDFEYDVQGRQTATIGHPVPAEDVGLGEDYEGNLVRFRTKTEYNPYGQQERRITNRIQVEDNEGNFVTIDYSQQQITDFAYDQFGNRVKTTFGVGTPVESYLLVRYDQHGRQTAEMQQTDDLYLVAFNDDPQVESFVVTGWDEDGDGEPDGTQPANALPLGSLIPTKVYEYDDQGRLSAVRLPAVPDPDNGNTPKRPTYEYGYDAQGNQTLIRDPLLRETHFTFDALGRQLTRTLPLGVGQASSLSSGTDVRSIAGDSGAFTEGFWYDDRGRQVRHESFEGVVTESVYDDKEDGDDSSDFVTGRLLETKFFTTEFDYNSNPNAPVETWTYQYDAFGRQTNVVSSLRDEITANYNVTRSVTQTYDAQGRLTSVVAPEGTLHYDYDVHGRHMRTWTTAADQSIRTDTHYVFDALGRLDAVEVHTRNSQSLAPPEVTDYVYDLIGNLDQVRSPGDVISDYDYDELNRLELLRTFRDLPDGEEEKDGKYTAGVDALLAEYAYDLRADGKRRGVSETDSEGNTTRVDWAYDAIGRLIRESYDSHDNSLDFIADYLFDLSGNRVEKTLNTDPAFDTNGNPTDTIADELVSYLYDANDRLLQESLDSNNDGTAEQTTTYGYDHTQRTNKTVWQGVYADPPTVTKLSETHFQYNVQGRLSQVEADGNGTIDLTSEYVYDAMGIRVGQTVDGVTTRYLFDHHNPTGYEQVLEERDAAGNLIRSYTLGLDVIAQAEASGDVYHFLYDGHGSTRALTGGTEGTGVIAIVDGVVQRFSYDAYGNALGFNPTTAVTALLYSGEWFQIDIQQQYLRARWYDPATGTFSRLDPFAGNMHDPQSLHKYLYVHGDPVNGIDPTGELVLAVSISALGRSALRIGTGVAIVAVLVDIGLKAYLTFGFSPHPDDKTTAEYQARLAEIYNVMTVMVEVGDDYDAGGLPALNRRWNPPGGFRPALNPLPAHAAFPAADWSELRGAMRYVIIRYPRVEDFGVKVASPTGSAGFNHPFLPGIFVSHEQFWNDDIIAPADTITHEGIHDLHGPGHPVNGTICRLTTCPSSSSSPAIQRLKAFLQSHDDANVKSAWRYVLDEAAQR